MSTFLLGIDPSLVATGWICLDRDQITFGCIKTAPEQKKRHTFKADDTTRRLELLLDGALFPHLPMLQSASSRIVCEQPAGAQSASAASALGEVHGALVGALWASGLLPQTVWVAARDGKRALTGHYSASKLAMNRAARDWIGARSKVACIDFEEQPKYAAEAIADALGVLLASGLVK